MENLREFFESIAPNWQEIPHRCNSLNGWLIYEPFEMNSSDGEIGFLAWKRLPICNLGIRKLHKDNKHLFITVYVPGEGVGKITFTNRKMETTNSEDFPVLIALQEVEKRLTAYLLEIFCKQVEKYIETGGRLH